MHSSVQHRRPHGETGGETAAKQLSQQVRASNTIPLEWSEMYSTPYDLPKYKSERQMSCEEVISDEDSGIFISEGLACLIRFEFAFVRDESASREEMQPVICDSGVSTTIISSFDNRSDCHTCIYHWMISSVCATG